MSGRLRRAPLRRAGGVALALALLLLACASWQAAPAAANGPVELTVYNETTTPISLRQYGSHNCWKADDLADAVRVDPGTSTVLYTAISFSSGCTAGFSTDYHIGVAVFVKQPNGDYEVPVVTSDASKTDSHYANMRLEYDNDEEVYWKDMLPQDQWIPGSPTAAGAGGSGLLCVKGNDAKEHNNGKWYPNLIVEDAQDCTGAVPPSSAPARAAAGVEPLATASAAPRVASAAPVVYDLLELMVGGCQLAGPTGSACGNLDDDTRWDLVGVSSDILELRATQNPLATYSWGLLGEPEEVDNANGDTPASETFTVGWTQGSESSTSTTKGFEIGGSVSFGNPTEGPINGGPSGSYDFSTTQTRTSGTTTSESSSVTVTAPSGENAWLYPFQSTANEGFDYTADLTFGDLSGKAQPIETPYTVALGTSPALLHPCIGYLIGDKTVDESVMALYDAAVAAGYYPTYPGLNDDEANFMSAGASFSTSSSSACPGFPSAFAAGAAFDGSGTMVANAYSPASSSDNQADWAPGLEGIVYCTYDEQPGQYPRPDPSNPDDPCGSSTEGPPGSHADGAGYVVNSSNTDGVRRTGTAMSDLIQADDDKRTRDELRGRAGRFDVLHGSRYAEELYGGAGEDVLLAGGGDDHLETGGGRDSAYGGAGDDTLFDVAGAGALFGEAGDDRLLAGRRSRAGLFGGHGADTLVLESAAAPAHGGAGHDTYVVKVRSGKPRIVELARGGKDRVVTAARSLRVPAHVEVAQLRGPRGGRLVAGPGAQRLIGGRGDDVLIGGEGPDSLHGGRGDDRLLIGRIGHDLARGGAGADRFVLEGRPLRLPTLPLARHARASLIADFDAREGDRLVLRTSVLGRRLGQLRARMTLVQSREPRARGRRPALLFDRDSGLLSYDRDGARAGQPEVVAMFAGQRRIPPRAIRIVGGGG